MATTPAPASSVWGGLFSSAADLVGQSINKIGGAKIEAVAQKIQGKRDISYIQSLMGSLAGSKPNDVGGAVTENMGSTAQQYTQGGLFTRDGSGRMTGLSFMGKMIAFAIIGVLVLVLIRRRKK